MKNILETYRNLESYQDTGKFYMKYIHSYLPEEGEEEEMGIFTTSYQENILKFDIEIQKSFGLEWLEFLKPKKSKKSILQITKQSIDSDLLPKKIQKIKTRHFYKYKQYISDDFALGNIAGYTPIPKVLLSQISFLRV